MCFGEYICCLKHGGRFKIPYEFRKKLYTENGGKRLISFAACDTLRVYPESKIGPYIKSEEQKLEYCCSDGLEQLIKMTKEHNALHWSIFGTAVIPKAFLRQYGLTPGMKLVLQGDFEQYFEISPLEKYKINSPTLRQELGFKNGFFSQKQADNVYSISMKGGFPNAAKELLPFKQLRDLSLVACSLCDISFLEEFSELHSLCLWKNSIKDSSVLGSLPNLIRLHIGQNPITGLDAVQKLRQLEGLTAFECRLSSLPELPASSPIKSLVLSGNRLAELNFLANLTQLKELRINSNLISDLMPLAGIAELKYLHIANNRINDIGPLLGLPKLCFANVEGNPVDMPERQKLMVHTVLNKYTNTILENSAYDNKRQDFISRYSKEAVDKELPGLLFDIIHVKCNVNDESYTENRRTASMDYSLDKNKDALGKVLAMPDCYEKTRILKWINENRALAVASSLDLEDICTPGRPGTMRFSQSRDGAIMGPGEHYVVDRSEYEELLIYPKLD